MEAWALSLAEAAAGSPLGVWMRGSAAGYPTANVVHLLGLVLLLGSALLMDLRLAGLFRWLPAEGLARLLLKTAVAGLLILVASGVAMFASDAAAFARSPMFRWKLAVILIALVNIAAFHGLWGSRFEGWDARAHPAARVMAAGSVLLWLTVATLGRLVAYS